MTDYVLEILDGDQAGDVVEFGDRLAIGRRPDNDLALKDEKCSGRHAEIVREDGGIVLRDLDSRNGTMMDGRPVKEVALQPGDEFQLGRTRMRFRLAGEAAAAAVEQGGDELQVSRLGDDLLARSGRRRSPALLVLLVVVLLAAGGYLMFGEQLLGDAGSGGAGGAGAKRSVPLVIDGNLLAKGVGDFEGRDQPSDGGGWALQAGGGESGAFLLTVGSAAANTGQGAVEARGGVPGGADDGEGAAPAEPVTWALAHSTDPLRVSAGAELKVSAHLFSEGRGRALVRLALFDAKELEAAIAALRPAPGEGEGEDGAQEPEVDPARALRQVLAGALRSGTALRSSDGDWSEVGASLVVPGGFDRAVVELLAEVPDADSAVGIDDVAVLEVGRREAVEARSDNGRSLGVAGAALLSDGPAGPFLLGAEPVFEEGSIGQQLAAAGLATVSDAGYATTVARREAGDGFVLSFTGGGAEGIALLLPTESAGLRVARGGGGFTTVEPDFNAADVTAILFGDGDLRTSLHFPAPTAVRGSMDRDDYRLELRGTLDCELRVSFTAERDQARALLQQAERAVSGGEPGRALSQLAELLATVPHDPTTTQAALGLRGRLLDEQRESVETLLREGREAAFFQARIGYQRVLTGVEQLRGRYQGVELPRDEELSAVVDSMQAGLAELDAAAGERHGALLGTLAGAFESAGETALAELLRGYVTANYPQAGTGDEDAGDRRDEEDK